MTLGYGITGIGYPSMLGNYGLVGSTAYGSYDAYMPSMMGMNGSLFGTNAMMNPMMMGMYNPMYMGQLMQGYEASQVDHAANMHSKITNNGVKAYGETDSALVQKIATNGDVQQGIKNLHTKVREGDQDGICKEFDKLKQYILTTYQDELAARGNKINPLTTTVQIIDSIYSNVVTAQNQANGSNEVASLEADIKKYGDGHLMNGFMSGFRSGHHEKYVDETLQHCYGYDIDRQSGKEVGQTITKGVGTVASVVEKGVYGCAIGGGTYALGAGISKGIAALCGKGSAIKFSSSWLGWAAAIGAVAGIAADIWWQCTDKDN